MGREYLVGSPLTTPADLTDSTLVPQVMTCQTSAARSETSPRSMRPSRRASLPRWRVRDVGFPRHRPGRGGGPDDPRHALGADRRPAAVFVRTWLIVAIGACLAGCSEIAWRYLKSSRTIERRRTQVVMRQFLPGPAAGALITSRSCASIRPPSSRAGIWSIAFALGIYSAASVSAGR